MCEKKGSTRTSIGENEEGASAEAIDLTNRRWTTAHQHYLAANIFEVIPIQEL
jgi:hypothetical protein